MPWSPDHKADTRRRILDAAALLFTRHGFAGASIDDVMRYAGLTRGAFYAHFSAKEALYAEALQHAAMVNIPRLEDAGSRELVQGYLSQAHRNGEAINCPLACLVSDVTRQEKQVRETYTRLFRGFVDRCKSTEDDATTRQQAIQQAVTMIGGMAIARALDDEALADEVLEACQALTGFSQA